MIENMILSSLIHSEDYCRKVLPYLKREYFEQIGDQIAFKLIESYFKKYHKPPTQHQLQMDLASSSLNEKSFEAGDKTINGLEKREAQLEWLVDSTEKFCKDRAFYNAVASAAELIGGQNNAEFGKALEMMQDALAVSFDNSLGMDYFSDAAARYDKQHSHVSKLPSTLKAFNNVLRGGFVDKSLTVFLAPVGVGKSMIMGYFAGTFIEQGFNVLYISLEMSEEQVGERVDAHLLDVSLDDMKSLGKDAYMSMIMKAGQRIRGKLKVKEYPAHSVNVTHFRSLIKDYRDREGFVPDVVMVDYLGICGCAAAGKNDNSYQKLKTTTEEIRSLGQEFGCRTFTAAQVNKEGTKTSDFEITDVAESWGIPQGADYMYGLISTEQLEKIGQMRIKRLKDRHNDVNHPRAFMVGLDRSKMKLYDLDIQSDPSASTSINDHEYDQTPESINMDRIADLLGD